MDQIFCKLRRDAGRSVCGTAHRVGQAVVPLIAGPFTKSSQSPECDPVPPQCGHSLCTYLGTVPSWLVRDGPDRDHQAIRNCLYRAEHSAD